MAAVPEALAGLGSYQNLNGSESTNGSEHIENVVWVMEGSWTRTGQGRAIFTVSQGGGI
jgi:hypothetical protein